LTHTRGLVACAIARSTSIGIDAERFDRTAAADIGHAVFSTGEVAYLDHLETSEHLIRFYELWTLKEAFVKAVGVGLRLQLNQFSFDLEHPGLIVFHPPSGVHGDVWQFATFTPIRETRMAVAVAGGRAIVPRCFPTTFGPSPLEQQER